MTQLSLSLGAVAADVPSAHRLARRTDPSTSHRAAERVVYSGTASNQRVAALLLVRRYPGRTARELSHIACDGTDALGDDAVTRYHALGRRLKEIPALYAETVTGLRSRRWWPVR